jgi:hypothetical protein
MALRLRLRRDEGGAWVVRSTLDPEKEDYEPLRLGNRTVDALRFGQATGETDADQMEQDPLMFFLEWIASTPLRTLRGEVLAAAKSGIKELLLSEYGWDALKRLAQYEKENSADGRGIVRLSLDVEADLARVPWELAFSGDAEDERVCLVRQTDRLSSPLIRSPHPVVGVIEALTKSERVVLTALQGLLVAPHARSLVSAQPATLDSLRKAARNLAPTSVDILHFTGHGDPRGGVLVFGGSSQSRGRGGARQGEDPPASESFSSSAFGELVNTYKPSIVVLASCGDVPKEAGWTLADSLIGIVGVRAVVSMREPIAADDLTVFGARLYRALLDHRPLDEAMLFARSALVSPSVNPIPQLRLNVVGDLQVWPAPEVGAIEGGAGQAPVLEILSPLPLVRFGDQLWQVAASRAGRLNLYPLGSADPGVRNGPTSVVVSPDSRIAVAVIGDRIDLAWVVQASARLKLIPWAPAGNLELPEPLRGRGAKVLAASVVFGETARLVVATDAGTYWAFASRSADCTVAWYGTHELSDEPAQGALDLPSGLGLVIRGELEGLDQSVFEGSPSVSIADHSWVGDRRVAAAATLDGVRGMIRVALSDAVGIWQPAELLDSSVDQTRVRGVAAVRRFQRPARGVNSDRIPIEIALVDAEGRVRVVAIDAPPTGHVIRR